MDKKIEIVGGQTALARDRETPVRLVVRFDQPTKVRGIRCRLYGAEKTEATYTKSTTDSKGQTKTETKTATEYVEIVNQEFLLQGDQRMGFFSRLIDSVATWVGGGKHEVIEAGEHGFSVNLKIPENAPASFKGKKCEVYYSLDVSVDLPIKIDWSLSQKFDVVPNPVDDAAINPVHVVFPDGSGRSIWDKTFGKDVKLNLAMDRDTFSVGDWGQAMLTVESPEPLRVDDMEISLVGQESSKAHGHTDGHSYKHSLGKIDSPKVLSSESVHEFEILIPKLDGPCSQTGKNFEVSWAIEVRLSIPWAKDPVIRIPVRIVPKQDEPPGTTV